MFAVLPHFLPGISKKVVDLTVQENEKELQLRKDLKQLEEEIKTINMVDQFAQYAKLERKINKAKDELAKYKKSKSEVFLKLKLGTNIIFHIVQLICMLFIIWNYRSEPLISLPSGWVWPVGRILAFPTGISGAIGVTAWLLVCRSVVRKGLQFSGFK